MDKLEPMALDNGKLTLRAPYRQIERVCRQQLDTVQDRLVGTLPVAVNEVVIVNGRD